MPHLILQYTDNIRQSVDFKALFTDFHQALDGFDGILALNCKSRAIPLHTFFAGDGVSSQCFVHVDVWIMEGRSSETKQIIGQKLMAILQTIYRPAILEQKLEITLAIHDLNKPAYQKFVPI